MPNLHRMTVAAVAASLMMLVFGLVHHAMAARLMRSASTISIPPDMLRELPLQIAGWAGEDVPLDEAIVRRTDTDAHVNRRYFP